MPMSKEELQRRYQHHTEAMGSAMRETRALIDATAQTDLEPEQLVSEIAGMLDGLTLAAYHASRMAVFARLLEARDLTSRVRGNINLS